MNTSFYFEIYTTIRKLQDMFSDFKYINIIKFNIFEACNIYIYIDVFEDEYLLQQIITNQYQILKKYANNLFFRHVHLKINISKNKSRNEQEPNIGYEYIDLEREISCQD